MPCNYRKITVRIGRSAVLRTYLLTKIGSCFAFVACFGRVESFGVMDRFQPLSRDAGVIMRGISGDGTSDRFIQSTQEMILRFSVEVSIQAEQWTRRLIDCPDDLLGIERLVHNA